MVPYTFDLLVVWFCADVVAFVFGALLGCLAGCGLVVVECLLWLLVVVVAFFGG